MDKIYNSKIFFKLLAIWDSSISSICKELLNEKRITNKKLLIDDSMKNLEEKIQKLVTEEVENSVKKLFPELVKIITDKNLKNKNDLTYYSKKIISGLYDPFFALNLPSRVYLIKKTITEKLSLYLAYKSKDSMRRLGYTELKNELNNLVGSLCLRLSHRLVISEVYRAERNFKVLYYKDSGATYLRWIRKSNRITKGDPCIEYAEHVNPLIVIRNKVKGIYKIEEYPEYPHPFCNCDIELIL